MTTTDAMSGANASPDAVSLMDLARALSHRRAQPATVLAARLGTSVDAIAATIAALRELAVDVQDSAGGLSLGKPLDLLDAMRLQAVQRQLPGLRVELVDECASTNAQLAARADAPSGTALVCEYQSAGRGRRGREWTSGIGGALTFSLLWRFACAPAALSGLSLAVAVIAAGELERQGFAGIGLKWPNDLLHDGRKLGGILIEIGRQARPEETACVIGIGLNVHLPAAVSARIERPVTDLAALAAGELPDRTTLLCALLGALAQQLPRYQTHGFADFRQAWLDRHVHQGRHVRLMVEDRLLLEGEARGIAEDGALLVQTHKGLERVVSGEVSLR